MDSKERQVLVQDYKQQNIVRTGDKPEMLRSFSQYFTWIFLRRVHIAMLMFTGLVSNYMLRVNLNLAIEFMTKEDSDGPHVEWTVDQKERIKGAFFLGYVVMQVPGGRLAEIFGSKRVFGYSMFLCAILTAITPAISCLHPDISFPAVYTLRVLQGITEGVCYPSLNPLTVRWVPESEKGRFVSFSYLGGTFGAVVTFPLCGIIISLTSWVWVFYITAIFTFVWFVLWIIFLYDFPESDPFITDSEKSLIVSERSFDPDQLTSDRKTPLIPLVSDILMTPAVWVDMMCDFCNQFGLYVLIVEGPPFLRHLLPIGQNADILGYLLSAPQLARAVYGFICGILTDYILRTGRLSRLNMHKVNTALSFLIPAIGMVVMSYLATPELQWVCIAVMIISFSFNGGCVSGYIQNILTLAPNRSGTLYGVTNGFGNLTGFLVPEIKRRIVLDEKSIEQWRWLFIMASSLYGLTTLFFVVLASNTVQMFNRKSYDGVTTFSYFTRSTKTESKTDLEAESP